MQAQVLLQNRNKVAVGQLRFAKRDLNSGPVSEARLVVSGGEDLRDAVILKDRRRLDMTPEAASRLTCAQVMSVLDVLIPDPQVRRSLNAANLQSGQPAVQPPVAGQENSAWLHQADIRLINPRASKTYLGMLKYALILPKGSVAYLQPLFTAGTDGNIYGHKNWLVSDEWMDPALTKAGYDTPEKQLKFLVGALNALGHPALMDVTLHADNFSEIVLENPDYFDWIRVVRNPAKPLDAQDTEPKLEFGDFGRDVQAVIADYLRETGGFYGEDLKTKTTEEIFVLPEDARSRLLFGQPNRLAAVQSEESQRKIRAEQRRMALLTRLNRAGYFPMPVVDHPPYRPLHFLEWAEDKENGLQWPIFTLCEDKNPPPWENIWGTLTPFKFFETAENDSPDPPRKREPVWRDYAKNWADFQKEYGFSGMREDMAHVQLGYHPDQEYIWGHLKRYIQQENKAPWFASFAESDLWGAGRKHDLASFLDAQQTDATLYHLHNCQADPEGHDYLRQVKEATGLPHRCKPVVTLSTQDADGRHNPNLQSSARNAVTAFFGYFLNLPFFMTASMETREEKPASDTHCITSFNRVYRDPETNEIQDFKYGNNAKFYQSLKRIQHVWEDIAETIQPQQLSWLQPAQKRSWREVLEKLVWWKKQENKANTQPSVGAWYYADQATGAPSYLMVANANIQEKQPARFENPFNASGNSNLKKVRSVQGHKFTLEPILSITKSDPGKLKKLKKTIPLKNKTITLTNLAPGECRVYKINRQTGTSNSR